jgi:adenosylhomocysteinase
MPDGARILVIAEGRLVNLGAAEGHPADVMDMSFADQALAAEWLLENGPAAGPGVHRLPRELDEDVARLKLESMGAGLEVLTPEQVAYLGSWRAGT